MKTLIGRLSGPGVPNLGRAHPAAFPSATGSNQHYPSKPLSLTAPFTPLRQPISGHGNPRKEHRAG